MSYIWRPGMRCVCIADDWSRFSDKGLPLPSNHPIKNHVYDIVEIGDLHPHGLHFVLLQCHPNFWWQAKWFRPVKETSIDIFTTMLNPLPIKQKEEA